MTEKDPLDELAAMAEAGVELANDPDKLRARLRIVEGDRAKQAREFVDSTIADGTFNDRMDRRDPALVEAIRVSSSKEAS